MRDLLFTIESDVILRVSNNALPQITTCKPRTTQQVLVSLLHMQKMAFHAWRINPANDIDAAL